MVEKVPVETVNVEVSGDEEEHRSDVELDWLLFSTFLDDDRLGMSRQSLSLHGQCI